MRAADDIPKRAASGAKKASRTASAVDATPHAGIADAPASAAVRTPAAASRAGQPVGAGKRERNGIRIREQIIAAARESFCELGFGASTVRDIMRRAGLAPGTFYNYFDDKETVLREIVVAFAARVRARVHIARMKATTLDELIQEAFRATFTLYSQDRLLVTLVTRNSGDVQQLIAANVMDLAIRDLADDLEARSEEFGIAGLDLESFALAGVALAGEFGFRLIQQRPFEIERTTHFVSELMLGGIERMSARRPRPAPDATTV